MLAGAERVMVPDSFDPVCVQVSLNVPAKAPPYLPDHLPDRSGPVVAARVADVGAAAGVDGAADVVAGAAPSTEADSGLVVALPVPLLLHPPLKSAVVTATSAIARLP
ncbi:MAG: hypothetical protein ACRDVG_15030 [Jatrophihabitantaceae bacterium]